MKLRELYFACDNVDDYRDVIVHDGGKKENLYNLYPREPILEREVEFFRVLGGCVLHVYMAKAEEVE